MPSLESLPLDLHFQIFSYLLRPPTDTPQTHPLHCLYRTGSKELQNSLTAYTNHTRARLQTFATRQPLSNRNDPLRSLESLLNFLSKHCVFCNKATVARAKARSHLVCCKECDNLHFPDKITLSDAVRNYTLQRFAAELRRTVPHGQYMCHAVPTTMFLLPDVIAFAEKKHGDLNVFFAKKEARKRKAEERKRRDEEYQARLLAEMCRANGVETVEGVEAFEPGLTPVEIVRRRVLNARIRGEGKLRERVQQLTETGYGPLTATMFPWQRRQPGIEPSNPEDPLDGEEFRFPLDEALADMFAAEFAGRESMDAEVYKKRENEWNEEWGMVNGVGMLRGGIPTREKQPWAMANYPVLVKEVCVQMPGEGVQKFKERAKVVERENEMKERIYEGVRRRYAGMIAEGRWFKR